ncbi:amino acid ABC transporter permease [Bradyrhizobium sp. 4]|uniref:amino acid ABC transporter permease n=1 Tax=unclassified Bradyrhizobium TaxID=2631580 RepID=UPI001FF73467|nr:MULTISPECIES: amino acid ABC transporter permease [unclassified Bradyrhizobium]MCK1401061.1 amino acid ABC transporter permease [Bradyrhizobium sp. 39]MCK1753132.1 amino acid ABC transporter permease [Bradyrhizobium sp. 135]UPJ37311.1 amino acid ABC transporter permease [Bradyrhizobium sp. 4]
MTAIADIPEAPRTARPQIGNPVLRWLRTNLFSSIPNGILSVVLLAVLAKTIFSFAQWGIANAVWLTPANDSSACRAVRGVGACWAIIPEKYRFILFGTYPFDEQWRPALAVLLFIALFYLSTRRALWRRELAYLWIAALALISLLMWGGILGLTFVSQDRWGGLPVTLILATFGLAFGFPLGILVALGRRSKLPAIRSLSVLYVELIRGVPLVSLLFMASVMFPLFMPNGFNIDKLLRAQVAIILFAGAYLAEVIRGGLQAVARGQYEAADALGLSYWRKNRLIVLPQAIRHVIPPAVNTFIAFFKDTSLVLIIGIFDLLTTAKTAIIDPAWQQFSVEVYIFVAGIYFVFCFAMSRYSRSLEATSGR